LTAEAREPSLRAMAERVVAIDLGKARVGVAVTDDLGLMAHARPHLDGKSRKALLRALVELAREERTERFLVGLPLEMSGQEGLAARRALAFAQELADATGVAVEMIDERLSTVEASRRLRDGGVSGRAQKDRIDGAAAAVLLQGWLDGRGRRARDPARD
jgi:putative Holliday junction resolvase